MDPIQLITLGGAAGMAVYVLHLLTEKNPKLHTHSEVAGLRSDKAQLWTANKELQASVAAANEMLTELVDILPEINQILEMVPQVYEVLAEIRGKREASG